jgi:hypothetical protein
VTPICNSTASRYWARLLKIAREEGVKVFMIPGCPGLEWEGLYLADEELGPGIALLAELPPEWLAWVLAHELGHHIERVNPRLFSPFLLPNDTVVSSRRESTSHNVSSFLRAQKGRRRRLDPNEERANEWAATMLIDLDEWRKAESRHPFDLNAIVGALQLPLPAGLAWERIRRRGASVSVSIELDHQSRATIEGATIGKGGHQSLFRRIQANRVGNRSSLTFVDFSLARERLLTVGGGWRHRYECVLNAILPEVVRAGGVGPLFALEKTPPGRH